MDTLTIRVSRSTHVLLRNLAEETGETMTEIVGRAVEAYRRKRFLEGVNESFGVLQADPSARADYDTEIELWDATLADGMEAGANESGDAGPGESVSW